ncbi:MAG: MMPL family transporter [Bacteroidales bacterium]|nr:MMPL family transporter [Bacteroidales bacterium]
MSNIFVGFHNLVSKRKIFFLVLFFLIILFSVYSITKIRLTEDIRAIIPNDDRINKINKVLSNSKFADQLIFNFSLKDKSSENTVLLIESAGYAVELLRKDTLYTKSVNFKNNEGSFIQVYDFIYDNLPLYLSNNDYARLDTLLSPHAIEKTIESNYKSLTSLVGLITKDFIFKDPLSITPMAIKKLESFQLDDNFIIYNSCIFTKDLKHLMVFLEPVFPASKTVENKILITQIEEALAQTKTHYPEIDIEYYGGTAVAVSNASRIKNDIILTVSIALFLMFTLLFFIFRKLKYILLIFFPISLGIVIALALMAIIYGDISAIALGIGAILIGISLDYSLHAFTHYRSSFSVKHTIESISMPIIMSCLSTVAAFLTLFIIHSQALKQLGLFAALAIIATAVIVLTVIPLFLKEKPKPISEKKSGATFFDKIASYPYEKNKILLIIFVLLSVVFIFSSRQLSFNSDISSLNYLSDDLKQAESNLKSISTQAHSATYFVIQGASYEEVLLKTEKNEPLFEEAKNKGIINSYSTPVTLIPSKEKQEISIKRWNEFWNADRKQHVKNLILEKGRLFHFQDEAFSEFYRLLDRDFSVKGTDEFQTIKDIFLKNNLSESGGIYSAVSIIKTEPSQKGKLFEMFAGNDDIIIFDNQYFTNRFLDVLKDDFRLLVLISMFVVFMILLIFFGRIEIALITFFPIFLSWFWTIGFMGLLGIEFNIFNIIISSFILGLGVDYSIFVMSGLINNYKYGHKNLTPYKLSVLLSALTTVICLGVLVFARHPALQSIAFVSTIGILSVIVVTYTILPILFSFLVCNKNKPRKEPVNMLNLIVSVVTLVIYLSGTLIATLLLPLIIILPASKRFKKGIVHRFICWSSRFIVYVNITIKKNYVYKEKLNFSKPVVFVSNHQSHLDLVLILLLNPRIVALTNSWVWNSPFFGSLIRYAGFYPAFKGLDYGVEKIKQKVDEGYSVLVFPEGGRTQDGKIRRFHQGALHLADILGLDIQPIIIHGAMQSLSKNEFFLKSGQITLTFYDRIKVEPVDIESGKTYKPQAKALTEFYRQEFAAIRARLETPLFFKHQLISQYIYKGPVLEWYMRIKTGMEHYYSFFNQHIPLEGKIMDIGCGYGFMSYMLALLSEKRKITGLDYDSEKIEVASNCQIKTSQMDFVAADVFDYDFGMHDAYILSDVLHYFNEEKQKRLIEKCIHNLNDKGVIIIRDADNTMKKRHWGTRYTEFFSTKTGFNKMNEGRLFFTSRHKITEIILSHGLDLEIVDNTKLTSNIVFIARKNFKNKPENE